ncbi:acetyl-CoA carboxylase biotin carboxylase subunit [Vulcanimicrobium alpinum]|uniref:Biotin carboxylase n=1 Tax=Vulcanimicrobium alpinum TaxID=3016050 RepID=A0AAN1XY45_UNVUL|nr:acetyl-CoA carboxylase biotin carboxylase subunit [Vulcanimicrobium alpinum]BDE07060.1 acetyl-CoA carboxylase biotin carboxylase subunit [Vulcanimicrobium alpinum]
MFRKVLIANRGEIALRINRACHELGVATVAIFSEADRQSLHVRHADEAFCVGPGPVARSYLNIPNIISAAMISGCDAIHPGYGFLAENARFAEIAADHGLTFIGPRPSVINAMGDKATAKRIMREAGVPTTPGSDIVASVEEAREVAERIGFPVLLKATAGGGGKGMRAVSEPEELPTAFATAQAEAEASFKDGRMYVEKLILNPRHIEVQVLADEHGGVVHLGERDCSVQKPSHQKLIEEAPAPELDHVLRARLHETAVTATRAVGYTNAGTLEFLVSGDDVYFMEMNTRIQVEHPVTELIYGVDLVKEQIRIASGESLGFSQDDLHPHGHAIEVRVNAEDPNHNFAPAAGTLTTVVFPGGPGIRVDTHVYGGAMVPPFYDSMLAKIVAVGRTRESAILRMERALDETRIEGVNTTVDFCREILADPEFRAGGIGVAWLPALLARRVATV